MKTPDDVTLQGEAAALRRTAASGSPGLSIRRRRPSRLCALVALAMLAVACSPGDPLAEGPPERLSEESVLEPVSGRVTEAFASWEATTPQLVVTSGGGNHRISAVNVPSGMRGRVSVTSSLGSTRAQRCNGQQPDHYIDLGTASIDGVLQGLPCTTRWDEMRAGDHLSLEVEITEGQWIPAASTVLDADGGPVLEWSLRSDGKAEANIFGLAPSGESWEGDIVRFRVERAGVSDRNQLVEDSAARDSGNYRWTTDELQPGDRIIVDRRDREGGSYTGVESRLFDTRYWGFDTAGQPNRPTISVSGQGRDKYVISGAGFPAGLTARIIVEDSSGAPRQQRCSADGSASIFGLGVANDDGTLPTGCKPQWDELRAGDLLRAEVRLSSGEWVTATSMVLGWENGPEIAWSLRSDGKLEANISHLPPGGGNWEGDVVRFRVHREGVADRYQTISNSAAQDSGNYRWSPDDLRPGDRLTVDRRDREDDAYTGIETRLVDTRFWGPFISVVFPDIIGTDWAAGAAIPVGLDVEVEEWAVPAGDERDGVVLDAWPSTETSVPLGTTVFIEVARALPPDDELVGTHIDDFRELYPNLRLTVTERQAPTWSTDAESGAIEQATFLDRGRVALQTVTLPDPLLPDVTGLAEAEAASMLSETYHMVVRRSALPVTSATFEGQVLLMSPAPGTQVAEGSPVTLLVGELESPPVDVAVPSLDGLTVAEAAARLENKGLALGSVQEVPATDDRVGLVIDGPFFSDFQRAPRGSHVNVWVGVAPPDLTGLPRDQAERRLADSPILPSHYDFQQQSMQFGYPVADGTVLTSLVSAGGSQPPKVTYVIASVERPDLIGLAFAEAEPTLDAADFWPDGGYQVRNSAVPVGSPWADAVMDVTTRSGGGVVVTVGREDFPQVPDVVGELLRTVRTELDQYEWRLELVTRTDVETGEILSVTPPTGTEVKPGDVIDIQIAVEPLNGRDYRETEVILQEFLTPAFDFSPDLPFGSPSHNHLVSAPVDDNVLRTPGEVVIATVSQMVPDADNDGLSNELELEVVERFMPEFVFSRVERDPADGAPDVGPGDAIPADDAATFVAEGNEFIFLYQVSPMTNRCSSSALGDSIMFTVVVTYAYDFLEGSNGLLPSGYEHHGDTERLRICIDRNGDDLVPAYLAITRHGHDTIYEYAERDARVFVDHDEEGVHEHGSIPAGLTGLEESEHVRLFVSAGKHAMYVTLGECLSYPSGAQANAWEELCSSEASGELRRPRLPLNVGEYAVADRLIETTADNVNLRLMFGDAEAIWLTPADEAAAEAEEDVDSDAFCGGRDTDDRHGTHRRRGTRTVPLLDAAVKWSLPRDALFAPNCAGGLHGKWYQQSPWKQPE